MKNKGKLITTSFIAGAAAALYASKQMNKNNTTMSATENNSYEYFPKASTQTPIGNTTQTAAEANNFYTKAPHTSIDYNYDSEPNTTIKIDSI